MKHYVVLDTNVLVSALLKGESIPGTLLKYVFSGMIIPVVTEDILKEYLEVLSRPKFCFSSEVVMEVLGSFVNFAVIVDVPHLSIPFIDPDDLVFYELFSSYGKYQETYLVTGNIRHFPEDPFIVTPRKMLEIIYSENTSNEIN